MEVVGSRLSRPAGGTVGELRRRLAVRVFSGERELPDEAPLPAGPLRLALALEAERAPEDGSASPSPPSSPEPVREPRPVDSAAAPQQPVAQEEEDEEEEEWAGSLLPRGLRAAAERDAERQRCAPPQPPLSAAYLAAVPPGRRPLYTDPPATV